ncbi:pyrroline-5-carboxylate reductase, partial [Candidatus Aerophobetes bacterium]|nr:pyrroline-5-carboxylate reductase [Candidatus Aerophobetes bacterium]
MANSSYKIGVIGAGKMGGTLIEAMLNKRVVPAESLFVCDKEEK